MNAFRDYQQDQAFLFPPRIGELVPEDEPVRLLSEAVDLLDIAPLMQREPQRSNAGAPAFHPRMMLKLLFFGYSHGVLSSRQLARFAQFDVRGIWLCGGQQPRHTAICDFRARHGHETIRALFVDILRICAEAGLAGCGTWAIDGTRVRANAGRGAVAQRETLQAELERVEQQIATALRDAEAADRDDDDPAPLPPGLRRRADRARRLRAAIANLDARESQTANATDPDAPTMQRTGAGAAPAYNAQATVDVATQLIVAAEVSVAQTDHAELLPQLEQATRNVGAPPRAVLADAGYSNGPNLAALEELDVPALIAHQREPETTRYFARSSFDRDEASDSYTCPAGRRLDYDRSEQRPSASGSYTRRVYRSADCGDCALSPACKDARTARRTLCVSEHDARLQAMRAKMASDNGRATYAQRKSSIEPAFGVIKSVLGLRQFTRRGLSAVRAEWLLICCAFNLRKWIARQTRERRAARKAS